MDGRDDIVAMVHGDGHQSLIRNGCGHVLTVPHVVVDGDEATGRSYALNIRWDADADRFWVARVSANTWRWVRTPQGWRIAERINANLDGTAEHREMLAPPAPAARRSECNGVVRSVWRNMKIGFIGPGRMGRPIARPLGGRGARRHCPGAPAARRGRPRRPTG